MLVEGIDTLITIDAKSNVILIDLCNGELTRYLHPLYEIQDQNYRLREITKGNLKKIE